MQFTNRLFLFLAVWLASLTAAQAACETKFSTAGFYELPGTGRTAQSMNPDWRFHRGSAPGAERPDYDDRGWRRVSLPDGIELLPVEASGCVNYQGEVWYRKHFRPAADLQGRRLFLHFEAIMGKSKVWVNGQLLAEHFGGYLPVVVDVTDVVRYDQDNVVAVMADNSDDPAYPPGKPQRDLDFTYFGGIYRDCWLVAHGPVYLTDPNYENIPAGAGLFVSYDKVSDASAEVRLDAHVRNQSDASFSGRLVYELYDKAGHCVLTREQSLRVARGKARALTTTVTVGQPHLWSPDSPYLYDLRVYVKDRDGHAVDGYSQRIGIRSFEFRGKDGFWLNGKPYPTPLIGANRHQDFAVVGNALSNSLHWRDAKKLRDAGLRVVRNAHYPQDPAFMDACDELGLLVISNTPGWQFWNDAPIFAERVYSDIRRIVRRDRNRPSVWLWEPILNETGYPDDFARRAVDVVREEYPYAGCYMACDVGARGQEYFPVRFTHPVNGGGEDLTADPANARLNFFTREWGDNVDDWSSHNSPSRASRRWGEEPMRVQASTYAKLNYRHTCYDALYRTPRQHVGGCLWHSFDHQRGYHPTPFYGGLMVAFRQPKYSYYMFCAQRPARTDSALLSATGPMVYIAHPMTPFSPAAVTVYSNCDEVRLTRGADGRQYTWRQPHDSVGMPSPVITFPDVFDVYTDKQLSRSRRQADSYLLAEGLIDGKVVATHKVMPARRPNRIKLWVDNEGVPLRADGSDMVVVVAAITDERGTIKRLSNETIRFEISGPGVLVADSATRTNPRPVEWGTAPVLVRATTTPGTIRVRASVVREGVHTPPPAELVIETKPAAQTLVRATDAD